MRIPSLLLSALLATPLAAQTPEIGPEPSVLFTPSPVEGPADPPLIRGRGARGAVIGGVLSFGIAMVGRVKDGSGGVCTLRAPRDGPAIDQCREPLNYGAGSALFAGVAGAALGYLIERSLQTRRAATPPIAPAPSVLFAQVQEPAPRDTLNTPRQGPWLAGAVVGTAVGIGAGVAAAAMAPDFDSGGASNEFVFGALGGLLGFFIGGSFAQEHPR